MAIPEFNKDLYCASDGFCHRSSDYCDFAICNLGDGDCDGDNQCEGDLLVCAKNNFSEYHPTVVNANPGHNVCVQPTDLESKYSICYY